MLEYIYRGVPTVLHFFCSDATYVLQGFYGGVTADIVFLLSLY